MGYADVEWRTPGIPTPNLATLKAEGAELLSHYSAPTCSPARAALLTGRYWSRFGIVTPNSKQCLPDGTATLASILKEDGYVTGITGKWHLGGVEYPDKKPSKFGFEYSYGCLDGHGHVYTHEYTPGGKGERGLKTWHRNGELIKEEGHITDLIGNEACQFIERNKDKPFFLYLPYTAPHEKCIEPEKWLNKVNITKGREHYAAMITHMDHTIGQVIETLKKHEIYNNTFIVFCSDNGGIQKGKNTPLKGNKSSVYEGGIRTVALATFPAKLKPQIINTAISITDWLPTFCELAGIELQTDLKTDGQSIWPQLNGTQTPQNRTFYAVGTHGKDYSLRQGKWKLIKSAKKTELYDLEKDLSEKNNLSNKYPEKVKELVELAEVEKAKDNDSVCKHIGGDLP